MPDWIIGAIATISTLGFVAVLGAWLAVEAEHRRLLQFMDAERRRPSA